MKTVSLIITAMLFLIASCATTIEEKQNIRAERLAYNEADIRNLTIKGKISTNFDGSSFSTKIKAKVAWMDSLHLTVIGPFGIPLGNVFAKNDRFVFYNTMQNEVITGNPETMDLGSLINISLKFEDLIHFLRNETLEPTANYEVDDNHKSANEVLYRNNKNKDYVEYVLFSLKNNTIRQYQRKLRDGGTLVLNILFRNHDSNNLAKEIIFNSPENKSSMTMEIDEILVNEIFNEPFSFPIPENAKKLQIIDQFD